MKRLRKNLRQALCAGIFIIGFAAVFIMSSAVSDGVKSGVELVLNILVPSLYMPLVLCAFLSKSGLIPAFGRIISKIPLKFFKNNGLTLAVFIASLISGYPSGAVLCSEMYRCGALDSACANRLSCCCVCAGPAFIVLGVGEGMLGSSLYGRILLISHILAAAILYLTLFWRYRSEQAAVYPSGQDITVCIVESVSSASRSMLGIAAYTVIFSALNCAVFAFFGENIGRLFAGLCEVTNACKYFAVSYNLPLISAALGFSGLSVIAQVASALKGLCSLSNLLLYRALNAVLSYIICTALLHIFPQALSAAVLKSAPSISANSATSALSLVLVLSSVVLLFSAYSEQKSLAKARHSL